jgi:large subunit ribosomal protein L21
MFAIVTIAGQQFKVRSGQEIYVHRLAGNVGDKLSFSEVLMTGGGEGAPKMGKDLSSSSIEGEILDHLKGDKVIVFKKKRRKGYQKSNGHRQSLTRIRIGAIA